MNIKKYLVQFPQTNELNIVGPLYEKPENLKGPIIFVDGGAGARIQEEGFSVGDGDSFIGELDEVLPKEKDFSDLAFVLRNIPSYVNELKLFGFLSGRRDHELVNFAEIHSFLKNCPTPTKVYFDKDVIAFSKGTWNVEVDGIFTLFAFEEIEVKLSGDCKYPIAKKLKPLSSEGLSNIGTGKITFINNAPLFLFLNHP